MGLWLRAGGMPEHVVEHWFTMGIDGASLGGVRAMLQAGAAGLAVSGSLLRSELGLGEDADYERFLARSETLFAQQGGGNHAGCDGGSEQDASVPSLGAKRCGCSPP